jgi:hypothetical protein
MLIKKVLKNPSKVDLLSSFANQRHLSVILNLYNPDYKLLLRYDHKI